MAPTCGSVFQNPKSQFFNTDTTGELAFGCENLNYSKEKTGAQIAKTVADLSLSHLMDRDIFKLSGGEKQQIACGSIYATDPEIYILDEPSSNMDAGAIARFRGILKTLKAQGKTVVISEHRLYFLMDLADRFLYFADGELKETYTPDQLRGFSSEELSAHGFRATDLTQVEGLAPPVTGADGLVLHNISCKRGKSVVLEIPHLVLPEKSVVAIIGENGAGKSTFAQVVTGLLKSKGTISLEGVSLKDKQRTALSYMVMQDVNRQLFSDTVEHEITLGAKAENLEQVDALLQGMELLQYKDRHPASLSGGQKQRVAICAAMAAEKPLMLYDEPTSGLDYVGMHNLCRLITSQREKHRVTMVITHDMELILGCCTHVLHLSKGQVAGFYPLDAQGVSALKQNFIKPLEVTQ